MATSPPHVSDPDAPPTFELAQEHESLFPRLPASDSVAGAIARHKRGVVALTLLVAVLGLLAGYTHKPTYTASATLEVGTVTPSSFGFVQSASQLATAFSQGVTAEPVLNEIHAKLGLTPGQAAARLSSAPVPLSPSFHVIATGPSKKAAINLANVASVAVVSYEVKANSTNAESSALLASYRSASKVLQEALARVAQLGGKGAKAHSSALTQADTTAAAAKLHADAIGAAYQSTLVDAGPSEGLVSLLASAVTASSDHKSKLELYGFIGLLAGLVLSCSFFALYEQIRKPRLTS